MPSTSSTTEDLSGATIQALSDTLDQTVATLCVANDQLVALYDLVGRSTVSLSEHELVAGIAHQTCGLLRASAVVVEGPSGVSASSGATDPVSQLQALTTGMAGDHQLRRADDAEASDAVIHRFQPSGVGSLAILGAPGHRLTTQELRLIGAIAGHAAGALELVRLHADELDNLRREHDLRTAAALTAQVLPRCLPQFDGVDIAARCDPAATASGDFYTAIDVGGRLVVAVGDVSGKGMPAAVVMTLVATAMRSTATRLAHSSAAEMLQAVSDHVYHYLDETGTFVTMVVAVWTSATGELDVANAGHSPVMVVSSVPNSPHRAARQWPPSCPPIGTLPELNATSSSVRLGMGEAVLFGTDGLAEQEDAAGRLFGYEPLARLIEAGRWTTADELIELVFDAIEAHGHGVQASDDRTCLVLVRRAGAGAAT